MPLTKYPELYSFQLDHAEALNQQLLAGFHRFSGADDIEKSHYFGDRYENIYIGADRIPAIKQILDTVTLQAGQILNQPADQLKAGLWFNAMGPGQLTTLHRHDVDDELLSAVYYVAVSDNSGNLILQCGPMRTEVTPKAGMFVFFPPDMEHEVTENKSQQMRLSLGINVGPR